MGTVTSPDRLNNFSMSTLRMEELTRCSRGLNNLFVCLFFVLHMLDGAFPIIDLEHNMENTYYIIVHIIHFYVSPWPIPVLD